MALESASERGESPGNEIKKRPRRTRRSSKARRGGAVTTSAIQETNPPTEPAATPATSSVPSARDAGGSRRRTRRRRSAKGVKPPEVNKPVSAAGATGDSTVATEAVAGPVPQKRETRRSSRRRRKQPPAEKGSLAPGTKAGGTESGHAPGGKGAESSAESAAGTQLARPGTTPRPASPPTWAGTGGAGGRPEPALSGAGRQMIINAASDDECRIAVVHENRLEELFFEQRGSVSHVGNIYKGIVTNIEPSIQAAFVILGMPRHGFLHISDVQPQYFAGHNGAPEGVGKKIPRRDRPPIQKCFRRGQEVIVQIIKEGLGTKGPTLSTYLSLPGRYLVMMPGMARLGVSRKIEDEESRRKMREVLSELKLPEDSGFILRTAGLDHTKRELQRDLNYLQRLWKTVLKRMRAAKAPAELYRESDLVTRTVRDVFGSDFDRIIVDNEVTAKRAREFLRIVMPRTSDDVVQVYNDPLPIFHRFDIEQQIEAIHARQVPLKSGGSVVIDSTEAMVAIDVNSGRFRDAADAEELAFQTNMEAAREIARQLRLRDLGGLIVCDFIDMRYDRHKRTVERALRDELKKHKERARILRMSQFGLIEMTRQRQGPPIKRGTYIDCPHCKGSGLIKARESMTLHVLRNIQMAIQQEGLARLTVSVSPDVAFDLQNRKRAVLHQLETNTGKTIIVRGDEGYTLDQQSYDGEDRQGNPVSLTAGQQPHVP